jgi:hypothetical protein
MDALLEKVIEAHGGLPTWNRFDKARPLSSAEKEGAEVWRVLRARFPSSIATHSPVQDFFFGEDFLLRRHDYSVDVAGGFGAAQLTSDYVEVQGTRLPTKQRAHTRGPDRRPSKRC